MLRSPRFYVISALLIVVLFLAWRLRSASGARTVKLHDGRILTIEDVTFGTEHKIYYGSVWSRLAARSLPAKWQAKTGAKSYVQKTATPSLMIWGKWQFPPQGANPTPWGLLREGAVELKYYGNPVGWPEKGTQIMAWNLEIFPRRASELHFEVREFTNDGFQSIAAFNLPNPVRRRYPVWEPQRFPVVQQRGDYQFEVVNFCEGVFVDETGVSQLGRPLLRTGCVAVVQVKRNERLLDNWQVEHAAMTDATGNRSAPRIPPSLKVGDYLLFGFPKEFAPLWPGEVACKIAPELTRTGGFSSNELCLLSAIPVPTGSGVTQILARAEANGLVLGGIELKRVGGGFWQQPINQNLEIGPFISQARPDQRLSLFEVTDDRGRKLRHDRSYFNTDGKHFGIELLPDSKTLDLTFAVQEPVVVEFLVGMSKANTPTAKAQR